MTVGLLFLFPLAFSQTEPRTFLVFFLTSKWRARQANKARAETIARRKQKAAERGLELAVNPAQEADPPPQTLPSPSVKHA